MNTPPAALYEPADRAEVPLLRSDWRQLIAQRKLRPRLTEDKIDRADRCDLPEAVCFRWEKVPGEAFLEIARDRDFSRTVRRIEVTGRETEEIFNLEVGRTYFWRIRTDRGVSEVRSFVTGDTPRYLRVPGGIPVNFRDAGGKRTLDGGRTRQGMIFRGSELNGTHYNITPEGVRFMREELKIRTDLDLRYPKKTARITASPLGDGVRWVRRPVNAYTGFTPEQSELFHAAIELFADPDGYPVYVHCSGGSDRTGEIVFLLDMLLGVDEERAFLDYEASSLSYYPRPRTIDYFQNWLAAIGKMSPAGTPLHEQVPNYLRSIGVADRTMDAIRAIMTEDR